MSLSLSGFLPSRNATLLACCVAAALSPVGALASDADIQALRQEVAELRARVEKLEGQLAEGVPVNLGRKVQPVAGGWHKTHNWNLLTKGMERNELIRTLGEPESVRKVGKFEYCYYGAGKVVLYLGRVSSWEKP